MTPRAEVVAGQDVPVSSDIQQINQYVQIYIDNQNLPTVRPQGLVVVGDVPKQAPAFQLRPELEILLSRSRPGVPVVRAVAGMDGVGKTQVAAAYARSCINAGWRLVAWVSAGDSAEVLNGLAEIATALRLSKPGMDLESIGQAVRDRLESDGQRCLVVFDNAIDLRGLVRFVPSAGQCQVIITSNQLETLELGTPIAVRVFTGQEALSFLVQRTGRTHAAGARDLAVELGFLPLALAQAAAVIVAQQLDYPTYLARLRAVPPQEFPARATGELYPYGLSEAIALALDAVADGDQTGLCRGLINVAAQLSAAGVPRALLYAAGQHGLLHYPGTGTATRQDIDEALGRLAGASLLTFSVDDATVAAHQLTMRVARDRQGRDGILAGVGLGIAGLLSIVTRSLFEPRRNQLAARDTVQQILALHEHLTPYLGEQDVALTLILLRLRGWAIWCLNALGDSFVQAIEYGQDLVADLERILGDTDPSTLASRDNLAAAYRAAGRLDDAIPLYERTLAGNEQVRGDTHPVTLVSRDNLALAYRAAGRLDEAIPLLERALADSERVRGGTHPNTLQSRNTLASAYQAAGRLGEAIPLLERILADRKQVLGDTHPNTLASRNNLAAAYEVAGRLGEAIPLLERILADRELALGAGHPDTLASRNNLALAYRAAGRLDEAIPLLERTLADSERILGATHPNTMASRNNLALAYQVAGLLSEAIPLYERTLADSEQILGATHPNTMVSRNNLAAAYRAAGRLDDAIPLLERTLADSERVLGKTHPNTLAFRNNLAAAYQAVGRLNKAD